MNTNIRTKVVNDTNELIFKNKDLLVDNSPDSDTTTTDDNVTVTIVQPKDTKYSIIVYIMEYRRSDEGDIFEADTDEGHKETFKAAKGSVYLVVLLDNTTNSTSTDYYRLNTSSRGKLTRDITIKFKDDSPATIKPKTYYYIAKGSSPWYQSNWSDKSHIVNTDVSVSGQATVTCDDDVINMNYMFQNCPNLTSIDLSNFDTSKVTDMSWMFDACSNLASLDLSSFFNTSKVTNMEYMFNQCYYLTTLDLSNFNTSKVTSMNHMFEDCYYLTSIDLSSFNTSKVTNMSNMFYSCPNLILLDLSNFDTSKVRDMVGMFYNCPNLTSLDLSNFDTSNVNDMGHMFMDCSGLTTIKGVIDMKSCTEYGLMFYDCPKLSGVKIRNPPAGFDGAGLSSSQYTIVS